MLKASLTTKKQTLKKYEEILYKPNLDERGLAFICQVKNCCKIFASHEFLVSHYKRKHNAFYMKEIRSAEEEKHKEELIAMTKDLAGKSTPLNKAELI